jgi:nitrate reductase NapE
MKTDVSPRSAASARATPATDEEDPAEVKREEFRSFLFFTVVMAPVLAVIIVAGYGFLVWMWQLISGPPGS